MKSHYIRIIAAGIVFLASSVLAQNQGNDLEFQGLEHLDVATARTAALPASEFASPDAGQALFSNPAGLSSVNSLSLSFSYGNTSQTWWENQEYRPNRLFVTLPFYFEGQYVPDPAHNGMLDSDVFYEGLLDTSYQVAEPDLGLDPYSRDASDWVKEHRLSGLTDFSLALPLGNKFVLSGGYATHQLAPSYDRNRTWQSPHLGYKAYGMPAMTDGIDTIRVDVFDFQRFSNLIMDEYAVAVAGKLGSHLSLGLGYSLYSGKSTDYELLNKFGIFNLIDQNDFTFTYDTLNIAYRGSSDWSGSQLRLSLGLDYERFGLSLALAGGGTMTRKWKYDYSVEDTSGITVSNVSGSVSMAVPNSIAVGMVFRPHENLNIQLAFQSKRYESTAPVTIQTDTIATAWTNQSIMSFGAEYRMFSALKLRAGYRSEPQVFIPDGAAVKDAGPVATAYSLGVGLELGHFGTFDLSWQRSDLKFADIYSTNTNYTRRQTERIMVGYQFKLN